MTISELYAELNRYPTVLNIEDELSFIKEVQKSDLDDIQLHIDEFICLLDFLQVSHHHGGIFDVCEENRQVFFDFAKWIREIQEHIEMNIEKYSDGFDTIFDGSNKSISHFN